MERRKFFQSGSLAVIAGAISPLGGCRPREGGISSQVKGAIEGNDNFVFNEVTVEDLQQKMEGGSETARSIAEAYLQRIAVIDQAGPELRAVIEINPQALQIADELDRERAQGKLRGALHGIPVMIKDNIDTGDQMQTTAGSLALVGWMAKQDSQVARKLRQAGALILGKTNLSEWANFRSFASSSGWSSRGGQTKNPYVLNRTPCGSSAGSAVAVAANLCALAIGTETNGSVVCPSSMNGIVGIKPTVGLIGRSGIIPISETQDTAGSMARTVRDAAILLAALSGVDEDDARTLEGEGKSQQDYLPFLKKDGLEGARIGVGKGFMGFNGRVDQLMIEAFEWMEKQGAVLFEVEGTVAETGGGDSFTIMLYEFKEGLNRYLAECGEAVKVKSLAELIVFNKQNKQELMPFFQQEILEMAESKGDLQSEEYVTALQNSLKGARQEGIDRVMDDLQLDAIVAPTGGPAWVTDLVFGDRKGGGGCSSAAARAGYPHVTVPMGRVHGLPVGISFFGRAWSEPLLLKLAYAYEQGTGERRAPGFRKRVGGN
ncbi:MAG: amidase [Verrucomicrobiota bacterium]